MNPKAFLVVDPARVITEPAQWEAFKDIFDAVEEEGTEWMTRLGKFTVSHAHSCPKGKRSSPRYAITSNSGIVAILYRPEGWSDKEASGMCGFACSSRRQAVDALCDMAWNL